jgi:hypothetical protein
MVTPEATVKQRATDQRRRRRNGPQTKKDRRAKRKRDKKSKKKERKKARKKDKKTRSLPEAELRLLRKDLAARLLSKVDKHLRGAFPRKYYKPDGKTLDEAQLEMVATPMIHQTLGNNSRNSQMEAKCFEMCKSIVKQRRAYVKRKPNTPIKTVIVISGSDSDTPQVNSRARASEAPNPDSDSDSDSDSVNSKKVSDLFEDDDEKGGDGGGDAASDDSDYRDPKVDNAAPSLPMKKRCQGENCTLLLDLDECFPEVCINY